MNKLLMSTVALAAVAGFAAGCGGGSSSPSSAPAPSSSTTAGLGPVAPSTQPQSANTSAPGVQTQPSLSAQQVADPLLPSQLSATLDKKSVRKLAQFFEDKVSNAYATGNADELDHYLAGNMLTGNRGTINYLNSQNKRNVYKIKVKSVTLQTNQAHHSVFTMSADMTVNYFYNPATKKIIDNGLPGPSQVQFIMFFDQNPKTKTWYWTGEKSAVNSSGATANGSGTVVDPQ